MARWPPRAQGAAWLCRGAQACPECCRAQGPHRSCSRECLHFSLPRTPPALSLWHLMVASSSPLQAPQASKSLHLQSEPQLPLSEAKSSEEMEIPQFSKIPVPFQTRCRSGHGPGRPAALRGRAAPQLGGRTSAAHQGNSFQQPEEKLLICLFEPSGAARALKGNISALTATFPMLSSSSSSSSTPKHLETLQAKFSDNVSGKEAGKSL